MTDGISFAAVVLAPRATSADAATIGVMVQEARAAGARAVVVGVPRGFRAPERSRVVHVGPGASDMSAVRAAMSQLANTSVGAALLWPLAAAAVGGPGLRALLAGASTGHVDLVALEGDDLAQGPVLVPRDAWLDLVTAGDAGLTALAATRVVRRVLP